VTDKEALFLFRMKEAEETLLDAQRMQKGGFSPRSITNRAYYAMFYGVLALLLKSDSALKTSKHVGIISLFDKEFIHSGKIDKRYSMMLHTMFNARQKSDYKDLVSDTPEEAAEYVKIAEEFVSRMKQFISEL